MSDHLDYLLTRRSVQAAFLAAPAPNEEQVEHMLRAAARVPDHKKLQPWRFLRFETAACEKLGTALAERCAVNEPNASEKRLETERQRFLRAPLVIAVVSSSNVAAPVPEWEQILSAGAVCMNLLHAAHACGFAAQWLTEWYAYDAEILGLLDLKSGERIAGFIHIGTSTIETSDRPRPDMAEIVSFWEG